MKRIFNKWQVEFSIKRPMEFFAPGWYRVSFGIFNLRLIPKEGSIIEKRHYRGFIFSFLVWFPIDIDNRYRK